MGILSSLLEVTADIITLPVAVIKDTVTMGGALTDEEAATPEVLKKLVDDILK